MALAKRYEFTVKDVDDTGVPVEQSQLSTKDKEHPRRVVGIAVKVSDKPEVASLVAKYAGSQEIEQESPRISAKFDKPRPGEKLPKHMLPGNQLTYIKPEKPAGGDDAIRLTMLPAVDYQPRTTATLYADIDVDVTHPDDLSNNGSLTYREPIGKMVFNGSEWHKHDVAPEALPEGEFNPRKTYLEQA